MALSVALSAGEGGRRSVSVEQSLKGKDVMTSVTFPLHPYVMTPVTFPLYTYGDDLSFISLVHLCK